MVVVKVYRRVDLTVLNMAEELAEKKVFEMADMLDAFVVGWMVVWMVVLLDIWKVVMKELIWVYSLAAM